MISEVRIKTKRNNKNIVKIHWLKLFRLILTKILYSFTSMFLLLFSLTISIIIISTLFLLNLPANRFIIDIQYFVLIFYSILLFIFVLLNAIKIFGTQFEDSTFLLVLTKPYSRRNIILTQYFTLFVTSFIFIFLDIFILLIFGGLLGSIMKLAYLKFYIITVLKLFCFTICFAIFLNICIVAFLALFASQNVFSIFIIFCSLFLLGSLPYSLMKLKTDNIQISFSNGVNSYSIEKIKEIILFKKYLKLNLIKYPNLTKNIYNFYNSLSIEELKNYNRDDVVEKRIVFFNENGLIKKDYSVSLQGKVLYWKERNQFNNEMISLKIYFKSYFFDLTQLKSNLDSDFKKDLLKIVEDYAKIDNFMSIQKTKAPWLLTYDLSKSYVKLLNNQETKITKDEINNIFLSPKNYLLEQNFREKYDEVFFNQVYFVLRSVEDYIYHQVYDYEIISNMPANIDDNYIKLVNIMKNYKIINFLNFIEHWNQIWTSFMGYYDNFWFNPLALSSINFYTQDNSLFSYPDFTLLLTGDNKIEMDNVDKIQNDSLIIFEYMTIAIILFYFSYHVFMKKIFVRRSLWIRYILLLLVYKTII